MIDGKPKNIYRIVHNFICWASYSSDVLCGYEKHHNDVIHTTKIFKISKLGIRSEKSCMNNFIGLMDSSDKIQEKTLFCPDDDEDR